MSTIVNATLIYGLVQTPVAVEGATTEKELVKFNLFHDPCDTQLKSPRMCPSCDKPPTPSEVIRGFKTPSGLLIKVTNDEYDVIHKSRQPVIVIDKFISWQGTENLPVRKSYYLISKDKLTDAYHVLSQTMAELEVDAMGRVNLWDRERPFKLVSISQGLLMMQVMFTADEIVDLPFQPDRYLNPGELDFARLVVQERMDTFSPADLAIEANQQMRKLGEAKAAGKAAPKVSKQKPLVPTSNLMETLEASLKSKPSRKKKVAA
jgi:Ku protein